MNAVSARLALTSLILSLVFAGMAFASPPQSKPTLPSFDEIDKDKDGIVTLPEIMVYPDNVAKILKSCDADHDSRLTRDEYASCKAVTDQAAKPAK
ncbi:hypothetical protein C8J98_10175 [Luteibacter sp. OK325]|jgi:hypothetical protein|uniref:hypothetical protein n=1 Tax=Luteibacter sp. OK325 TaxID=2135670 RepID=UPI000D3B850B|nr:hypothetical protein [Luteibacter sp. OK325]PTR34818.1 hypothetical protein C8J98_10175 [Luteibacter sp. OK325]